MKMVDLGALNDDLNGNDMQEKAWWNMFVRHYFMYRLDLHKALIYIHK